MTRPNEPADDSGITSARADDDPVADALDTGIGTGPREEPLAPAGSGGQAAEAVSATGTAAGIGTSTSTSTGTGTSTSTTEDHVTPADAGVQENLTRSPGVTGAPVTARSPRRAGRIARLWSAWVALWDRREDVTALASVRIILALVILYDNVQILLHDLVVPLYAVPPDGYADNYPGWSLKLLGHGPHGTTILFWTVMIATLAMLTGTFTRLACAVYVVVSSQLAYLAPQGDRGIDMMIRIFIGVLAFSQSHARWSVDSLLRRAIRRPYSRLVPAWPRYLLMLQLVWIYFSGGVNKSGAEWGPLGGFLALANTLADPHFARFAPGYIPTILPITRIATAVTVTFEITSPIWLLLYYFADTPPPANQATRIARLREFLNRRHARWIWMATGASFHVGIAVTMRLGIFPFGMLALYPTLLMPREVAAIGERLRFRRRRLAA